MPTKKNQRDGVFERKDRKGWWVSYVDSAGVRRKQKVETHTRTQALNALSALKTRAQTERVLGVKHQSEILTADLLTRYKRHQKALLKPSTYERLQSILGTLTAQLPERLKDISKASVASFVAARSESVAAGTVQKEASVLKHALRLAVEWDLIHSNPADRVRLPRLPEGRTRYLSPTELRSLLEAAPEWMRAPIALAAFTGMRRGELLNLRWKDVDLPGRRVYLHDTKNGSLRVLPLNRLAAGVLASLPAGAPAQPVLPGVDGPKLSVYTKRVMVSVGISDGSFHTLRHTAASMLVMHGADIYAVGQFLGHKTARMTQRYAHLSPQYMAATAGKLDAAFGTLALPDASAQHPLKSGDAVGTKERTKGSKRVQASQKRKGVERPVNTAV